MKKETLDRLSQQLSQLQHEVERLRAGTQEYPSPKMEKGEYVRQTYFDGQDDKVNQCFDQLYEVFESLVDRYPFAAATAGVFRWHDGRIMPWEMSWKGSTPEEIPAESMLKLEPFMNPKRVQLLKALLFRPLTGKEITEEVGLVGGQLYHHLKILEEAKLISKTEKDQYQISLGGAQLLVVISMASIYAWSLVGFK